MSSIESESSGGADLFDSQPSRKYNILSRPKRKIHSTKAEVMLPVESTDSSEDEDYVLTGDDTLSEHTEDSSEASQNSDSDSNDMNGTDDGPKCSKVMQIKSNQKSKNKNVKMNKGLKLKKTAQSNKSPKSIKKTGTANGDDTKDSTGIIKKKRKYTKKKQIFGNPLSDEETQKFISSFKNSKINLKNSSNKKLKKSHQAAGTSNVNKNTKSESINYPPQPTACSGPFIKSTTHYINSTSYSTYVVCQSHEPADTNDITCTNKKERIAKEKIPPITDQKSAWVCTLCNKQPKFIDGIGDLFGPYRISLNETDEDLTLEYRSGFHSNSDNLMFKEVWFHEGCAVWTPDIYLVNNRIKGISSVLDTSSTLKCVSCKATGATLMCCKHGCKKVFHFPCALMAGSQFNKNNFTIYCKKHRL